MDAGTSETSAKPSDADATADRIENFEIAANNPNSIKNGGGLGDVVVVCMNGVVASVVMGAVLLTIC